MAKKKGDALPPSEAEHDEDAAEEALDASADDEAVDADADAEGDEDAEEDAGEESGDESGEESAEESAAQEGGDPLASHARLVLGAAGEDDDTAAALDEFADYASLDDEYPEDDEAAATDEAAEAGAPESDDPDAAAALIPPKERRVADLRLEARIEAVVFAAQKPLKTVEILEILADPALTEDHVQTSLDQLVEFYEDRCGGFGLRYLKRLGYQFQTSEAAGAIMERMFASRPRPISRAALETLSIIAYRQPVTRAEVEFIRGVDAGSIFKTLLERELIKCVGRKEIIGRPMLFGTTDNFLTVFNLSSIKDLPPLESFQPSREAMQGALEKIEGGDDGLLTDVEEYIADNTRAEGEGDELDLELGEELAELEAEAEDRVGAEAADKVGAEAADEIGAEGEAEETTEAEETLEATPAAVEPAEPLADEPLPDPLPEGGGDLDL
jgi:segregation and condensation protein B